MENNLKFEPREKELVKENLILKAQLEAIKNITSHNTITIHPYESKNKKRRMITIPDILLNYLKGERENNPSDEYVIAF